MLSDRNLTSHTFREKTAIEIANHVLKSYEDELRDLLKRMKAS